MVRSGRLGVAGKEWRGTVGSGAVWRGEAGKERNGLAGYGWFGCGVAR
ncbi:MAG: hypothetical protein GQ468_02820 [Candidatus Scalindua sp.]|nr:hypothetical protein [Candidatus Scalindua sp.]